MDKKIKNLFKIAKKVHKSDDFKKAFDKISDNDSLKKGKFGKIIKEVKKHLKW